MRCVFRVSDGQYCDSEESHPSGVTDETMIASANVIGRFGGVANDYVVVVTTDENPSLCNLVDGIAVRDASLESIADAGDAASQAKIDRMAELHSRAVARTATLAELCELVAGE